MLKSNCRRRKRFLVDPWYQTQSIGCARCRYWTFIIHLRAQRQSNTCCLQAKTLPYAIPLPVGADESHLTPGGDDEQSLDWAPRHHARASDPEPQLEYSIFNAYSRRHRTRPPSSDYSHFLGIPWLRRMDDGLVYRLF